jgi:hypothetical protein
MNDLEQPSLTSRAGPPFWLEVAAARWRRRWGTAGGDADSKISWRPRQDPTIAVQSPSSPSPPWPAKRKRTTPRQQSRRRQHLSSLFGKQRPDPELTDVHHGHWSARGIRPSPPQLACYRDLLILGIKPNSTEGKHNLTLLYTHGLRPPLSRSLRPTKTPEERERGAGEGEETLKGTVHPWERGMGKWDCVSNPYRWIPLAMPLLGKCFDLYRCMRLFTK